MNHNAEQVFAPNTEHSIWLAGLSVGVHDNRPTMQRACGSAFRWHARTSRCWRHCAALRTVSGTTVEVSQDWRVGKNEVHVLWLRPEKVDPPPLNFLVEEEMGHVLQARDNSIRRERLLSKAIVRTVLANSLGPGISPSELRFWANEYGKPVLDPSWVKTQGGACEDMLDLEFNLTHSKSIIGVAICKGMSIGLDVEDLSRSPRHNIEKLASKKFHPHEANKLKEISNDDERKRKFLQFWTLKEAFVKAKGTGINAPPGLKGFCIDLAGMDQSTPVCHFEKMDQQAIHHEVQFACSMHEEDKFGFLLFQPSLDHIAALCVSMDELSCGMQKSIKIKMWEVFPEPNWTSFKLRQLVDVPIIGIGGFKGLIEF